MSGDAVNDGLGDAAGVGDVLVGGVLVAGALVGAVVVGGSLDGDELDKGLGDGDVVATSAGTADPGVGDVEAATGTAKPYQLTRLNTTTNMTTHAQTRDTGVTRAVSPVALTTA